MQDLIPPLPLLLPPSLSLPLLPLLPLSLALSLSLISIQSVVEAAAAAAAAAAALYVDPWQEDSSRRYIPEAKLPEQHGRCENRRLPVPAGGLLAPGGREKWEGGRESREFHGRRAMAVNHLPVQP